MTITKAPPLAHARQRLRQFGASHLTDAEVLALLIGSGIKSRDALDLATSLLRATGGLHRLAEKAEAARGRVSEVSQGGGGS